MEFIIIGLLLITLAVVLIVLYKVRKMHIATHQFHDENWKRIGKLYAQIESLVALYYKLRFREPLPPLRGFAASPDFLRALTDYCLTHKPKVIVECSSGVSSLVLSKCCEINGCGHVYSLENGEEYANKTRSYVQAEGLSQWAEIIHAPLVTYTLDGDQYKWYELENLPDVVIDLLVIDGPPGFLGKNARYPAAPLLYQRLSPTASIFLDDASRNDEKSIIDKWLADYPDLRSEKVQAEKGCIRLYMRKA